MAVNIGVTTNDQDVTNEDPGTPDGQGRWFRDVPAEGVLKNSRVRFEYLKSVEISTIDLASSRQNQARIGVTVHQDLVDEYTIAMKSGAKFPALVAFRNQYGIYILAGGNHRISAAINAGYKFADLYLVTSNNEATRRMITTTLNLKNGARTSREDAMEQAISWMKIYGRSLADTASHYGVPVSSLQFRLRNMQTQDRLMKASVDTKGLNKMSLAALASIQNDHVLQEAGAFQAEFHVRDADFKRMVRDLRDARTEADQLAVVKSWRTREDLPQLRRGRAGGKVASGPAKNRAEMARCFTTLRRLMIKNPSRGQLGLSEDADYQRALQLSYEITDRLEKSQNGGSPTSV